MLKCGDVIASSDQQKANILNNTFTNSFNHSIPGIGHGDLPDVALVDCPTEFLCTEDEVYELLFNLDITKANGPDDISTKMLKETALSITPIVTHLFNISITLGELSCCNIIDIADKQHRTKYQASQPTHSVQTL